MLNSKIEAREYKSICTWFFYIKDEVYLHSGASVLGLMAVGIDLVDHGGRGTYYRFATGKREPLGLLTKSSS